MPPFPPTIPNRFSTELHDRGGSKYTQKLGVVITRHPKLVSCQKKIFYRVWEATKVGLVVDSLYFFA